MSIGIIGNRVRWRATAAALVGLALVAAACGDDDSAATATTAAAATTAGAPATTTASAESTAPAAGSTATTTGATLSDDPVELALVGYSVSKTGNDAAQKAFAETPDGKGVSWTSSYGASGDQSRAVAAGLKADFVHFSLSTDVTRLADAGLVAADWDQGANHGIVTDSVVVFTVRKGNPKHLKTWQDLVHDGVGIVTPNPGSSGSARWNVLAGWGSVIAASGTEADAQDWLTKFFNNVVALPGSGRDATTAFLGGTGDVLVSYENEAILARQQGEDVDYVIPDTTLLIENPGAVLKDADSHAKAYLDFVLSKAGQEAFASVGFRPLDGEKVDGIKGANDPANPFPAPAKLLHIDDDFGGWSQAAKKFFDENDGIVTKTQQATGKT
jgi:sulfate/thiosulfate transport system substrate-binding protein